MKDLAKTKYNCDLKTTKEEVELQLDTLRKSLAKTELEMIQEGFDDIKSGGGNEDPPFTEPAFEEV